MDAKQTISQIPYESKFFAGDSAPVMSYGFVLSKESNTKVVNVHFYVDLFEDQEQKKQIDKLYFIISTELDIDRTSLTDDEYYQLFKKGALLGITQVNIILSTKYQSKTLFQVPTEKALHETFDQCKNNVLPEDEVPM
jgi:hypothetical protein